MRIIHIQEFYKWALNKEYIKRLPFEIKKRSIKNLLQTAPTLNLPKKPNRKVKAQSDKDFDNILATNPRKSTALNKRDEIIAEIVRYMGLRRSEIANLTKEQFLNLDPNEEYLIDLHAMEWEYCVFQKNNKVAACEAKTGPIESRSEPSTCGRCKFLCTGKENIEFWQQSVLLHQDIIQNKFVTPIMKKESDKMITIGINILNKHQEKE